MNKEDKFLEDILVFVDRNGSIISKESGGVSCSLKMSYNHNGLSIYMDAYANGMGNGSCGAKVSYKGKLVYEARGMFTSSPFNTKVYEYIPGEWESLIKLEGD